MRAKVFFAFCIASFFCLPVVHAGDVLKDVSYTGEVIIGVSCCDRPFIFEEINGETRELSGFDIDITRAVVKRLGYEPKFVTIDEPELIPLVAEGQIHLAPGMVHRRHWEKAIDFSVTYLEGGIRVLALKGGGVTKLKDLRFKKIAVPKGEIGDAGDAISSMFPEAEVVSISDIPEGISLLKDREVRAVIGEMRALLDAATGDEKSKSLILLSEPIVTYPYAMGLPPKNSSWKELVDFALMDIYISGEFSEMYQRWFGGSFPFTVEKGFAVEVWPE